MRVDLTRVKPKVNSARRATTTSNVRRRPDTCQAKAFKSKCPPSTRRLAAASVLKTAFHPISFPGWRVARRSVRFAAAAMLRRHCKGHARLPSRAPRSQQPLLAWSISGRLRLLRGACCSRKSARRHQSTSPRHYTQPAISTYLQPKSARRPM
jgi:hypothetical protein